MEFYISTFMFSSGIIQGILLVFALLRKRAGFYPNLFLVAFIAVITLQVLVKFLDIYFKPGHIGPMYSASYYLPYLYGPLMYLYIGRSLSENKSFRAQSVLHFLPFIFSVSIVFVTGYDIIHVFNYINNFLYNLGDTAAQIISLSAYVLACRKIINKNSGKALNNSRQMLFKWFKNFSNIVWVTGITVIILFTLVFYKVELFSIQFSNFGPAFILLPLTIYWISYTVLTETELITSRSDLYGTDIPSLKDHTNDYIKYQNNRLTENELNSIIEALRRYMELKKPYLDPKLSLDSLSVMINIPRHQVSQAVNMKLKINFNDYINLQRVEYAKKELLNPKKQNLTIAAIAFESGFNSISTFNETFRKTASMTPSQFKKSMINS
jgi:AraC-like DNA-binding protein